MPTDLICTSHALRWTLDDETDEIISRPTLPCSDRCAKHLAIPHHFDVAEKDASLGCGHIWTATDCPAYWTYDPAECSCQ